MTKIIVITFICRILLKQNEMLYAQDHIFLGKIESLNCSNINVLIIYKILVIYLIIWAEFPVVLQYRDNP